jgi:hypothetical protein
MAANPRAPRSRITHLLVALCTVALGTTIAPGAASAASEATTAATAAQVAPTTLTGVQHIFVAGCAFSDTDLSFPNIANDGIKQVLANVSSYFQHESNGLVVLDAPYWGWTTLPDNAAKYQAEMAKDPANGPAQMLSDCHDNVTSILPAGTTPASYKAVVMLFNDDLGFASQTDHDATGTWIRLRFTGGQGGWTSEATWAHELGHAFGLEHSTWFERTGDNMYSNDYDPMSAFGASTNTRWSFPIGGVCNGITTRPKCVYADTRKAAAVPVGLPPFQKAKLGWISPETIVEPPIGPSQVQLSSPVYSRGGGGPVQLVKAPYGADGAYFAIDLRRKDGGFFEQGLPTGDSVVVYTVEPLLDEAGDQAGADLVSNWGDATVVAVVPPGGTYSGHGLMLRYDYLQLDSRAMLSISRDDTVPPSTALLDVVPLVWTNQANVRIVATDQPGGAGIEAVNASVDDGFTCQNRWPAPCAAVTGPLHLGEGPHNVTYWSVDRYGNTERPHVAQVLIDTTAPVLTPTNLPASSVWSNHDVAVDFTCTGSGAYEQSPLVAGDAQHVVVTGEGGNLAVVPDASRCIDEAGNQAVPAPLGVNIDRTPPRLQFTGVQEGMTYTVGNAPAAGCTAVDDLAGLSGSCRIATTAASGPNPVGAFTAAADATDLAGNTTTASLSYHVVYGWNGLTTPADTATPIRARATVRLQFALTDAGGRRIRTAHATLRRGTTTIGSFTVRPSGIYRFDFVPSSIGAPAGPLPLEISLDDATTHPVNLTIR